MIVIFLRLGWKKCEKSWSHSPTVHPQTACVKCQDELPLVVSRPFLFLPSLLRACKDEINTHR